MYTRDTYECLAIMLADPQYTKTSAHTRMVNGVTATGVCLKEIVWC